MIEDDIKTRIGMLTSKLEEIKEVEKIVDGLKGETYINHFGREITFGDEVQGFYDKYIREDSTSNKKDEVLPHSTSTTDKIRVQNFSVEKIHGYSGEDVLTHLEGKVAYLNEAIRIYEETKGSDEKKLEYILNSEETNKHLLSMGYLNDVADYLNSILYKFSTDNNLEYFRLTASNSQFSDREMQVKVTLDTDKVPSIYLYTHIDPKDRIDTYPKYTGVEGKYSTVSMGEAKLGTALGKIKESLENKEADYSEACTELNLLKGNKAKEFVLKRQIKRLEKERTIKLETLTTETYKLMRVKEDVGNYLKRLTYFEEHLPDILAEQEVVMGYLGQLLGIDFRYIEATFSN